MIICGDRRNLQKDKHHCNTPPICALWRCGQTPSSIQCGHMKEFSSAHHLHSTIPKVKCAGSSLKLWSCFSASGTEGLVRVEEKINAPKYWDSLKENPVQSIQNLRLGRMSTFQQDNEPKHTARVAYTQRCECLWVAQPESEIEPNQVFLEKPENVRLPPSNLTELERWRDEKNGR